MNSSTQRSAGVTQKELNDEAFREFTFIDIVRTFEFDALHKIIGATPVCDVATKIVPRDSVVRAMRSAWRRRRQGAACLQRAAVLTRLLRRYGINAALIIGYKLTPELKAHAWVEASGTIVGDFDNEAASYIELDRW